MSNIKNENKVTLSMCIVLFALTNASTAQDLMKYNQSPTPLIKIAAPKPNFYISMSNDTNIANDHGLPERLMTIPENHFGPGDPICEDRTGDLASEWAALKVKYNVIEGQEEGYYDPFRTGKYRPYLRDVIGGIEYDKYIGAIPIDRCRTDTYAATIYTRLFPEIIEKYSKRANIGFGGYGSTALPKYRSSAIFMNDKGGHPQDYCPPGTYCKLGYHYDVFKDVLYNGGDFTKARESVDYREVDKLKDQAYYDVFMQPVEDMSKYTSNDWQEVDKKIRYKILGEFKRPESWIML